MPTNKRAKIEQQRLDRQTQEDEMFVVEKEIGRFSPGPHIYEDFPLSGNNATLPTVNRDQKLQEAIGRFCTTFSILHSGKTLREMQINAERGRG